LSESISFNQNGSDFNSGALINFKNQFEKIALEKLLTDKHIKEAVLQVKEYCEDLMCQYAAICNGEVWIIFKITSTNQNPWKKLPAYVIKSLDFFENNYTEAINFLGYTSVINKLSLQSLVGVSKILHPEIYFPSPSIKAFK
jgi:L-cysteine desulfidase